jgi:peroxiredoxin
MVGLILSRRTFMDAWQPALVAAGFGAIIFASGRAITGKVMGAVLGGAVGIGAGAYLGNWCIGQYVYRVPAPAEAGNRIEIAGPTLDGREFDLQSLRGKVVLVDFWATWCGPCVRELPNVRKAYDRYHKKGFEVVGVSLDNSRDSLAQFVEQKEIPWPQIFFADADLQGWNNPLARRYHVDGIPCTFLIDRDGRVAGENVRGHDLDPAIADVLSVEASKDATGDSGGTRMKAVFFPLGLLVGSVLGCAIGSLGGAFVERANHKQAAAPHSFGPPSDDPPATKA